MQQPLIEINNWSRGASLDKNFAGEGQFRIGEGIDFWSRAPMVTNFPSHANLTLSGQSDLGVKLLSIKRATKDGNVYFGGDDATLYMQNSTGTIISVNPSGQTGGIDCLADYNDLLIYFQNTTAGNSDLAGTPTYTDNWQAGLTAQTDRQAHISGFNNILYFTNVGTIGSYDGTTWSNNALDLQADWVAVDIEDFGIDYLAIAANDNSSGDGISKVFLWDRYFTSWQDEIIVPENKIQAIKFIAGYLYIWAGESANIYVCPIGSRRPTLLKKFERADPTADSFTVHPNSVEFNDGRIYFGLSTVDAASDDETPPGIYSINADPTNFNIALMYDEGSNSATAPQGMNVRAVEYCNFAGGALYFAHDFNDASAVANENLHIFKTYTSSSSIYSGNSYIETNDILAPAGKKFVFEGFGLDFLDVASGGDFNLWYSTDGGTSYTALPITVSTGDTTKYVRHTVKTDRIMFKIFIDSGDAKKAYLRRLFTTGKLAEDER